MVRRRTRNAKIGCSTHPSGTLRFLFFSPPDWDGLFFFGHLPFSFGMVCTRSASVMGFSCYSTALSAAVSLPRGGQDSIPGGCEVLGFEGLRS